MTLDADAYITGFDNEYSSYPNPINNNEPAYYLSGKSHTEGLEAESTIIALIRLYGGS